MRHTKNDLIKALEEINAQLAASGSTYFLKFAPRYEWQAVDVYRVRPDGRVTCNNNLETGTTRKCIEAAYKYLSAYKGYTYPDQKINRTQAKALAIIAGIDFKKEAPQLSFFELQTLGQLAKLTKYRKPRGACSSLGSCFFNHLDKKINIDQSKLKAAC